jgi:hypothetical protein
MLLQGSRGVALRVHDERGSHTSDRCRVVLHHGFGEGADEFGGHQLRIAGKPSAQFPVLSVEARPQCEREQRARWFPVLLLTREQRLEHPILGGRCSSTAAQVFQQVLWVRERL